jgi:hypothetical protein
MKKQNKITVPIKNKKIDLHKKSHKPVSLMDIADKDKLAKEKRVIVPIIKNKSFKESLALAKGYDPLTNQLREMDWESGANELMKPGSNGTKVPFVGTNMGRFAVNPCSVNQSTLFRIVETHDVVRRCHETNVSTVISGIGGYKHPEKHIQDYGLRFWKTVRGGVADVTAKLMTSMIQGNAIGRMQSFVNEDGELMMSEMAHTPPISTAFTLTAEGDVEDLYQYVYGVPLGQVQNILSSGQSFNNLFNLNQDMFGAELNPYSSLGDLTFPLRSYLINQWGLYQLNKEECVHYVFDRINGKINPYGYSLARSLFDEWMGLTTLENLELGAFARFANPLLVAYADNMATVDMGDGNSIPAVEALYYAMQNWTSESAIILSGMKDDFFHVEAISTQADFKAFNEANKYKEARIEKAMLNPAGIYDSSTSYAGMTTQNSIYIRTMTAIGKDIVENALIGQIMAYYIKQNFGKHITDFGYFETSPLSIEDRQKESKIFSEMSTNGYMSPSFMLQANFIYKTLGYPELDEAQFKELQAARAKDAELGLVPKQNKDTTSKTETKSDGDLYSKRSITEGL